MGYRSDVGLALNKQSAALLKGSMLLSPHASDIAHLLDEAEKYTHKKSGDELYYWSSIKWYGFDSIHWLTEFLKNLEDERSWYLIRIGEELDDIETNGSYVDNNFNLEICRCVNFDREEK